MANFTAYDTNTMSSQDLVSNLLAEGSKISVDMASFTARVGTAYSSTIQHPIPFANGTNISIYDGNIEGLNMDAGLLLSSGTATPPLENTMELYSSAINFADVNLVDTDLQTTAKNAFGGAGQVVDITKIEFKFTVNDLYANGIKFDLMFGSDEYPEYIDSAYIDIAGVYLNGKNVALFNNSDTQPLSVTKKNLDMGNFRDNTNKTLPIEYDGVSNKLTIYAPIEVGENTIKIAIADTGDNIYDSGLFIANMKETPLEGNGLSFVTEGTDSSDSVTGKTDNETFDLGAGDDIINPGEGDDVILAGDGNDIIYSGFGNNQIDGGFGVDEALYDNIGFNPSLVKIQDNQTIIINDGDGNDTLLNVENIKFKDNVVISTDEMFREDNLAKIYIAYFGRAADPDGLNYWDEQIKKAVDGGQNYDDAVKDVVNGFAMSAEAEKIYPGITSASMDDTQINQFVNSVYKNLFNRDSDEAGLNYWAAEVRIMQNEGTPLGSIIKTIINGAQDNPGQLDRTFMQNKAQASWNYAKQFEFTSKDWDDSHYNEAVDILNAVKHDESSVDSVYATILGLTGQSTDAV